MTSTDGQLGLPVAVIQERSRIPRRVEADETNQNDIVGRRDNKKEEPHNTFSLKIK